MSVELERGTPDAPAQNKISAAAIRFAIDNGQFHEDDLPIPVRTIGELQTHLLYAAMALGISANPLRDERGYVIHNPLVARERAQPAAALVIAAQNLRYEQPS